MISNATRALWNKAFLLFFVAGFLCHPVRGATNVNSNYETPPLERGSIQWQNLQRNAKKRQELYRKRITVPTAFATNAPKIYGANFLAVSKTAPRPATPSSTPLWRLVRTILWIVFFVCAGIATVKRFFPGFFTDLNREFNPWAPVPAGGKRLPEEVRAEGAAFARFLTTFRTGPVSAQGAEVVGKLVTIGEFCARARKHIRTQQALLQEIVRQSDALAAQPKLNDLLSEMKALKTEADFPGVLVVWQLASALEGLLEQLVERTRNVTPSTLRAVVEGVNLLEILCVQDLNPNLLTGRPPKFLVVDDDVISRQAVFFAIKKAFGQPDVAADGETALNQIHQQAYDAIFLDVQLPGMDGFELCTKIHETETNRTTPVVFVTVQSDFEARAKSALSGGNDLMAKPFLTFEITVKALTLVLENRLAPRVQKSAWPTAGTESFARFAAVRSSANIPAETRALLAAYPVPAGESLTGAFLSRVSARLESLQTLCQKMLQASNDETRQNLLVEGFLQINSLVPNNGDKIPHPACQICISLDGLFKKLLQNPKHSTPSTFATIAEAVNLLRDFCRMGTTANLGTNPLLDLLVVDDDLVSRRVIVGALQTIFIRPENVEDGETAVALAKERAFDAIFLDIIMPGMDGFEVCAKIRETDCNRDTPVIFVTASNDVKLRGRASIVGGSDLLVKPFLTQELIVKALTFGLRNRLGQKKNVVAEKK